MIRWVAIIAVTISWLVLPAAGNADVRVPDCYQSMAQMDMPMSVMDPAMAERMGLSTDGSSAAEFPCSKGSPCGLMQAGVCAPTCVVQSALLVAELRRLPGSSFYSFWEQNLLRGLTVQPSVPPNILGARNI